MKISKLGLDLIKHYEGIHDGDLSVIGLQPKMDPIGIWTVGYGRALVGEDGKYLKGEANKEVAYAMYPNLTEEQASVMLDEDCDIREKRVSSLGLSLDQGEFDSLVSFTYNVGFGNLLGSTLLKYIKSNAGEEAITWAFSRYNKGRRDGKLIVLPGLVKRRKSEAILFLTGKLDFDEKQ